MQNRRPTQVPSGVANVTEQAIHSSAFRRIADTSVGGTPRHHCTAGTQKRRGPAKALMALAKALARLSRTRPTTAIDTACPVGFNPDGRVGQIKFVKDARLDEHEM